jgi:ABC-type glycerol-3-phosphate transport system substrate-binding protein
MPQEDKMGKRVTLRAIRLAVLLATLVVTSSVQAVSAARIAAAAGEVVITCQNCEPSATDVFSQSRYEVVQAFNKRYAGRYRIVVQHYGGTANDLQYLERLELAGALPDIFVAQSTILQVLGKGGGLLDVAPYLAKDPAWKNSFYPDAFQSLTGPKGQLWGIAEERDVVGIFYNKALFAKAHLTSFPTTWSAFLDACKKLKAAGVIPFAMDGDWVTQLMWANLIGTQPGGARFLLSGIRNGHYSSNPIVVKATEFLKMLHTAGYVNKDAFTGDYPNASNPFLQEQAAMIANGPWMVQADIQGKSALPGLYKQVGYALSPGWTAGGQGVIVLPGNAGWASGSRDPAKQAAAVAFMKFTTSPDIQIQRTVATGAYWAVKLNPTPAQLKQLDPLTYHLHSIADAVKYHYPHAKFATLQPFTDAWKNYWPGYVQGSLSTTAFLDKLSQAELTAQSSS